MVTLKKITAGVALASSAATLYTVPDGANTVLKEVLLCNTDSSSRTVTLHIVPLGGTPTTATTIVSAQSIAAGVTERLVFTTVMSAGDMLQAVASVAGVVSLRASGVVSS